MHLCCKVDPNNHGVPRSNVDIIFIRAILTDGSIIQLEIRGTLGISHDGYTFVHMGRRPLRNMRIIFEDSSVDSTVI